MKRVIVAAVAALLAVPVAASARVIQAETVLPPGQSGHVPQSGTQPAPGRPGGPLRVLRLQVRRLRPAGHDGVGRRRDDHARRLRRAERARRPTTTTCGSASATRWPRTGSCSSSCSGAPPRAGSPRCSASRAWTTTSSARRDYYTLPELRRMLGKLPAPLRARFDAYAEGVNLWLAKLQADPSLRPNEFVLLGLTPAPWRAVDSASVGVQLARTIPSDDGRELENLKALRKLGAKRFNRFLPLRTRRPGRDHPGLRGALPVQPRPHAQGREGRLQALAALPARACALPKAAAALGGADPRRLRTPGPCAAAATAPGSSTARSSASRSPSSSPSSRCTGPGSTRAASRRPACRWSASAATTTSPGASPAA